jgi:hypothetical protein
MKPKYLTRADLERRPPDLTRYQIANLVDMRSLLRARAEKSTNPVQAKVYHLAAAAIELGLEEEAGVVLEDGPGGGTSWRRVEKPNLEEDSK